LLLLSSVISVLNVDALSFFNNDSANLSSLASVNPPPTPTLVNPYNGAVAKVAGNHYTVGFVWSSSDGATDYDLEINGPRNYLLTITPTSTGVDLVFGEYTWRVRAHNNYGYSDWSPLWNFQVVSLYAPAAPNLIGPSNGAKIITNHYGVVTMSCSGVSDATDYQLSWYGGGYGNENSPHIVNTTSLRFVDGTNFSPSTYFWKVRSHNNIGYSEWSDKWFFTTFIVPPPPKLVLPLNDANIYGHLVTFQWEPDVDANGANLDYQLQISSLLPQNSTSNIFDSADTAFSAQFLTEGLYSWRVRTFDHESIGDYSNWTDLWYFTIHNPVPAPTPTPLSWANKIWIVVDGTWNVANNKMYGSDSAEALIIADNTVQTDYAVTMNTIIYTGTESSLVIRYVDANNFYWMGIGCWGHEFSIGRILNGVSTELAGSGLASNVQQGVTYTLKAVGSGNTLTLYVNGFQVLQIADSAFGSGAFGINTYNSSIQALDISAAPAPTPHPTPTITPTPTPTATLTPTITPSPTPTTNPTASPSSSPFPTQTAALTPTPSANPTTSPSSTPTPSPSQSPTPTTAPTPISTSTVSPTPTPSLNPSATLTPATLSPTQSNPSSSPSPLSQPTETPLYLYAAAVLAIVAITTTALGIAKKR
jgi:hypothetical protein